MITVNAIGEKCPVPVVKTKKALQEITGPETVQVLVDNDVAVQNVTKMAENAGGKVTSEKTGDKEYTITIQMEGAPTFDSEEEATCETGPSGDTVVVISADHMGEGNEELGKVLIKGFIYALTQLDTLPKSVLFYNGGAKLTTEGSDSLEDLHTLEDMGVEIYTCGTCLDYYGLKEKLSVGSVTNMYSIVEMLSGAGKVLRP